MKTNVRQHTRHTKHKVADVTEHTRKIKDRQVVAVIPIKNLKYKQAKAIFPRLNPNGDYDRDGVKNKKDCRPFDAMRQDDDFLDDPRMEDEKEDDLSLELNEGSKFNKKENVDNMKYDFDDEAYEKLSPAKKRMVEEGYSVKEYNEQEAERQSEREAEERAEDAMFNTDNRRRRSPD